MTTTADKQYLALLQYIVRTGELVETRNHLTKSSIDVPTITFNSCPIVTVRRTAWKKALREMEWFLSGNLECPAELLDWWGGQLGDCNNKPVYFAGYSEQFRSFSSFDDNKFFEFDQIKFILDGLKNNSNSRRLILTSWNPGEMSIITELNNNTLTPTTCHNTMTQFFVRSGKLHIKTYQRSADVLLGVPHNWVQTWAMGLYFAYHANLEMRSLQWTFGDAHIYQEESHLEVIKEILLESDNIEAASRNDVILDYAPSTLDYDKAGVPIFLANNFRLLGSFTKPISIIRPKLL